MRYDVIRAIKMFKIDGSRKEKNITNSQYLYGYLFKIYRPLFETDDACRVKIGEAVGKDRLTIRHHLNKFFNYIKSEGKYRKGYLFFEETMKSVTSIAELEEIRDSLIENLLDIQKLILIRKK